MKIHGVKISWSISERDAANMPEQELDKLVEQLDVIVERLTQYARDNSPAKIIVDVS